jgi:hypothetical protein
MLYSHNFKILNATLILFPWIAFTFVRSQKSNVGIRTLHNIDEVVGRFQIGDRMVPCEHAKAEYQNIIKRSLLENNRLWISNRKFLKIINIDR